MSIKIAIIGAGSIGFTRNIVRDILSVPEMSDTHFAFMDINEKNLDMVTQLVKRDIEFNKVNAKITATLDQTEAITNADYVMSFVRVGGLEAFEKDIEIPLRYGIDQCVGDTLCTGGIMYGQRTIPVLLDICQDIIDYANPNCVFFNYSNPNAMNTWACNEYGGVFTIGLCHGVIHGASQIEAALGIPHGELDYICAGINHQTWYIQLIHKGKDVSRDLLAALKNHPEYSVQEKVRIDMLEKFGYYSTESNGHLSEYVPWYRKRPEEIKNWISLDSWINGETGGYLRVCKEGRHSFETDFPKWIAEDPFTFSSETRSVEHVSYIIEALETGKIYRGHFNMVNNGIITNLLAGSIVEVPVYVDGNGFNVPIVGELPTACAAICSQSIFVQKLAVEAAVFGDFDLLRQALLLDPLTGAVCTTPEIYAMADDLISEMEEWLPQYKASIKEAKKRIEER